MEFIIALHLQQNLFQFLYNHRLTQRRSQSAKAESAYNLDLARAFLEKQGIPIVEPSVPYLQFSEQEIATQKTKLAKLLGISTACKWVFVHSSTGGSATSLSLEQYATLLNNLTENLDCQVILTAGKGEEERANTLASQLTQKRRFMPKMMACKILAVQLLVPIFLLQVQQVHYILQGR